MVFGGLVECYNTVLARKGAVGPSLGRRVDLYLCSLCTCYASLVAASHQERRRYESAVLSSIHSHVERHLASLLGHSLVTTSRWQTQVNLEGIIDKPLEGRQRSNHNDPRRQSIPKTREANVAINPAQRLAHRLARLSIRIQLRHHNVGRMRHGRTPNTCNVSPQEGNARLLQCAEALLRLA